MALTIDVDWGDGTAHGTALADSHTYATTGSYTILETVTDTVYGTSATTSHVVAVGTASAPGQLGPVSIDTPTGVVPLTVTATVDPGDAGASTYAFDFGNGVTVGPQAGTSATGTYPNVGTYLVTVSGYDSAGTLIDTATATVTVLAPPAVSYSDITVHDVLAPPGNAGAAVPVTGTATLRAVAPDRISTVYRTDTHASLMAPLVILVTDPSGQYGFTVPAPSLLSPPNSYFTLERSVNGGSRDVVSFLPDGSSSTVWLDTLVAVVPGSTPVAGGATVADATTTTRGVLTLAGDLTGTAAAPTVPALAVKVDSADPRLSDQRVPVDGSVTTAKIAAQAVTAATVAADVATQTELDALDATAVGAIPTSALGVSVATLDANGRVLASQLPVGTDPVSLLLATRGS